MTRPSLLNIGRVQVMGIVNVTPDSFSDGGLYYDADSAVRRALQLVEEGADLLDIGGESTRPGSDPVSADEELRRVAPVIEALAGEVNVPLSIDTCKPEVAEACLNLGASIVNDVTGFRDPAMLRAAADRAASIVIMHMRGTPKVMQQHTDYIDVVAEVKQFLAGRVAAARAAGIEDIAVDPGIGFAKTAAQNFELLKRLGELQELGCPVLAGPSRKSFLSVLPGQESAADRLEGTLAAVTVAVMHGAAVVRVHDVRASKRVVAVAERVRDA